MTNPVSADQHAAAQALTIAYREEWLPLREMLNPYDALHAVRAGFPQRLDDERAALATWDRAISLADNAAVANTNSQRRDEIPDR